MGASCEDRVTRRKKVLDAALDFLPAKARYVGTDDDWESIGIMQRPVRLPVDFLR